MWALCVFLFPMILLHSQPAQATCRIPAIYNFGDSNSDTGGLVAAFPPVVPPNGETFFHHTAGRFCDGRLIIDFLAQGLGLPYLSPYLQAIGSNFRHGANFASAAATAQLPNTTIFQTGISPFFLGVQVSEFRQLKAQALEFYSKGMYLDALPKPDEFGNSLYTIDIGQNDFTSRLTQLTIPQVKSFLPEVIGDIAGAVQSLYNEGARYFLVTNLGPVGCLPFMLTNLPHKASDLDENGCLVPYNNAVDYFNLLLKTKLNELQAELLGASVIYVDSHFIKYELVANASLHGFRYTTRACCGAGGEHNFSPEVFCGKSKLVNGKLLTAEACPNPSLYTNWDGVHNTEAANHYIASQILTGKFFQPAFSLKELCDLIPI